MDIYRPTISEVLSTYGIGGAYMNGYAFDEDVLTRDVVFSEPTWDESGSATGRVRTWPALTDTYGTLTLHILSTCSWYDGTYGATCSVVLTSGGTTLIGFESTGAEETFTVTTAQYNAGLVIEITASASGGRDPNYDTNGWASASIEEVWLEADGGSGPPVTTSSAIKVLRLR